jgi:hypothetical protein
LTFSLPFCICIVDSLNSPIGSTRYMEIKMIWLRPVLLSIICYLTISLHPQLASATSGNLFGIQSGLVRIDPLTGTVVKISNLSLASLVQGVSTFDSAGHRYFFIGDDNSSNRRLFSISTQTGEVLASPLIGQVGSIEFDVSTNTLFGIQSGLVRIDPLTGTVVKISNLSLASLVPGVSTFDSAGHRYFFIGDDNSSNRRLFSISTQTGEVLASPLIGQVGSIEFESLPPPAPVPTLHHLGILIMTILLGVSAIYLMKMRRVH